jgi:hypothetical protein
MASFQDLLLKGKKMFLPIIVIHFIPSGGDYWKGILPAGV